jgi:hypothetical protein
MQTRALVKEPSIRRHNRRDAHGVIRSGRAGRIDDAGQRRVSENGGGCYQTGQRLALIAVGAYARGAVCTMLCAAVSSPVLAKREPVFSETAYPVVNA